MWKTSLDVYKNTQIKKKNNSLVIYSGVLHPAVNKFHKFFIFLKLGDDDERK